jgi:hypothetical protein
MTTSTTTSSNMHRDRDARWKSDVTVCDWNDKNAITKKFKVARKVHFEELPA